MLSIDTNILLHAFNEDSSRHEAVACSLKVGRL